MTDGPPPSSACGPGRRGQRAHLFQGLRCANATRVAEHLQGEAQGSAPLAPWQALARASGVTHGPPLSDTIKAQQTCSASSGSGLALAKRSRRWRRSSWTKVTRQSRDLLHMAWMELAWMHALWQHGRTCSRALPCDAAPTAAAIVSALFGVLASLNTKPLGAMRPLVLAGAPRLADVGVALLLLLCVPEAALAA